MTSHRLSPKQEIAKLAEDDPDFRRHYTLEQLAERCGVTRQRIWQIVGPSGYQRPVRHDSAERRTVEAFLRKHPHAVRRPSEGGMTDDEIAHACGVTRAVVVRTRKACGLRRKRARAAPRPISRKRNRPVRTRRVPQRTTVRTRLQELEAREPDLVSRYTSNDLAAMLGVTPQAVRRVVGPLRRDGRLITSRRLRERLVEFLKAHPDASRPVGNGGLPLKEVARRLDVSPKRVTKWWRELELPPRCKNLGGPKRVLRYEVCVECGRTFHWTAEKEKNLRSGSAVAVVCGVACGIRQGRRRRGLPLPRGRQGRPTSARAHKA